MKTLCDQLNERRETITDKHLACFLFASLPLDKNEVLITSLDAQGENNLQFDRLRYLQSFDCEVFTDSTKKDSKLSILNVGDNNHWVPGTQVNGFIYDICGFLNVIGHGIMTMHVDMVAKNDSYSKQNYHQ